MAQKILCNWLGDCIDHIEFLAFCGKWLVEEGEFGVRFQECDGFLVDHLRDGMR